MPKFNKPIRGGGYTYVHAHWSTCVTNVVNEVTLLIDLQKLVCAVYKNVFAATPIDDSCM